MHSRRGSKRSPLFLLAAAGLLATDALAQSTVRASVDSAGLSGDDRSIKPAISADGRSVAFQSLATNLAVGDSNATWDIYVHDFVTGATTRASVDSGGAGANQLSIAPAISADGRFVAFQSLASNLVAGDGNGVSDVFVHDRQSGAMERVSVDSNGVEGDGESDGVALTADGRLVVFRSAATNLVPGDTNGAIDVFVRDRLLGTTERVSLDSNGAQPAPGSACDRASISGDGRFVVFDSTAANLVPLDVNGMLDVFVRDRANGTTALVSLASSGAQGNGVSVEGSISAGGRWVAFHSAASNLVSGDTNSTQDVFVRDLLTGTTQRASVTSAGVEGDSASFAATITRDGRCIAFFSFATNLVAGDTNGKSDIFVHDLASAATVRVSVDSSGVEGDDDSRLAAISEDGRFVAMQSAATNLAPGDANSGDDIFLRDRGAPSTFPLSYCTAKVNSLGCTPAISSSGAPSASATQGFVIAATEVRNNKSGLLFYGVSGRTSVPFQGGTLCVKPPLRRTPVVNSGGSFPPGADCSGILALDMAAFASGLLGGTPLAALQQPGSVIDCQWWSRDPGFPPPFNTSLSDALEYLVEP